MTLISQIFNEFLVQLGYLVGLVFIFGFRYQATIEFLKRIGIKSLDNSYVLFGVFLLLSITFFTVGAILNDIYNHAKSADGSGSEGMSYVAVRGMAILISAACLIGVWLNRGFVSWLQGLVLLPAFGVFFSALYFSLLFQIINAVLKAIRKS